MNQVTKWKTRKGYAVFEDGKKVKEVNQPWEIVGAVKVTDPRRIVELAQMKKCLYNTQTKRHIPAAFVQNYQLVRVVMMINAGILYEYEKRA